MAGTFAWPMFWSHFFVFFCFNNGAQGGRDHGSGHAAAIEFAKRRSLPTVLSAKARSVLILLNFLTAAAVAVRGTTA
jgi:Mn2+/Fe2+ NRAMP family transporter